LRDDLINKAVQISLNKKKKKPNRKEQEKETKTKPRHNLNKQQQSRACQKNFHGKHMAVTSYHNIPTDCISSLQVGECISNGSSCHLLELANISGFTPTCKVHATEIGKNQIIYKTSY
jgi:hypothetical protein